MKGVRKDKTRKRLFRRIVKQGGKPMLTGARNFLWNYRNDSPFQKPGGGLESMDTRWAFSLAGFLRIPNPATQWRGGGRDDSSSLKSRYLMLGESQNWETKTTTPQDWGGIARWLIFRLKVYGLSISFQIATMRGPEDLSLGAYLGR